MWSVAPYTEEELRRQTQARPPGFEEESDQLRVELQAYLAGVNEYIAEARVDPSKMPGEYAAINDFDGPDDFVPADVVATADAALYRSKVEGRNRVTGPIEPDQLLDHPTGGPADNPEGATRSGGPDN